MTTRVIRVRLDPSGVQTGIRGAQNALGGFGRRIKGVGRAVFSLKGALIGLTGALGIRQLIRTADQYTRIQNRIRIVTDSTDELTQVTESLFDIAQKTRVPLEATAQLYSRAAIAAGELGATSEELLRVTELAGEAIAITGGAAADSTGALRQLSQAFSSGIVRGEEFNSILEGAFPLAQAAARGLDEAGGSVGRLRTLVIEGKVTSEEFFRAILDGGESLDEAFGKTIPTVAQATTVLGNSFLALIGGIDQASGATGAISIAIKEFSDFIDENREEIIEWVNTAVTGIIVGGRAIVDFFRTVDTQLAGIVADIVGTTGVILESLGFETGTSLVEQAIGARAEINADLAAVEADFLAFTDRLSAASEFADPSAGEEFKIPIVPPNTAEDVAEARDAVNDFLTSLENAEVELSLTATKGEDAAEAIRQYKEDLALASAENEIFGKLIPTDEVEALRASFREFAEESIAAQRALREEIEAGEIEKAFNEQIEALELEIELLGADNEAIAANAELRALAAGATDLQAQKIGELTKTLLDETDELKKQNQTLQGFFEEVGRSAQQTLSGFLADPLSEGLDELPFKFAQVLQKLAADALASELFTILQGLGSGGKGGGAGGFLQFIGGLFGGGFQAGGQVRGGQPIAVGERGVEIFSPPGSGAITPNVNINQAAQGPPIVNVVNVTDPADIPGGLRTSEGEEEVINIIQRNPDAVRRVLG